MTELLLNTFQCRNSDMMAISNMMTSIVQIIDTTTVLVVLEHLQQNALLFRLKPANHHTSLLLLSHSKFRQFFGFFLTRACVGF